MILADVMDGLAALIPASTATNVYAYPAEQVTVPCAVVGYPTEFDFDITFMRGGDRAVFPVWLLLATSRTIDARDSLSTALTGVASFKEALDGSHAFGAVRVTDAEIAEVNVAGVTYVGLKHSVEVLG